LGARPIPSATTEHDWHLTVAFSRGYPPRLCVPSTVKGDRSVRVYFNAMNEQSQLDLMIAQSTPVAVFA
jgi:hypothetical protein